MIASRFFGHDVLLIFIYVLIDCSNNISTHTKFNATVHTMTSEFLFFSFFNFHYLINMHRLSRSGPGAHNT